MTNRRPETSGSLGFWMCVALVVGNTIGISIFLLPAVLAPFGFNALAGWDVTVVGCLVLARVFASLARQFPRADGPFAYLRATLGEPAAFIALWCYWISVWCGNAVVATGVVAYLQAALPPAHSLPAPAIAVGVLWLFVLVNLFGVRAGGRVQMVSAIVKLLPMAAVIGLGGWILVSHPDAYVRQPPVTPLTVPQTMAAATLALFAMLGFECAAVPAGRVRDPGRTIPRATLAGTLVTAAIYVAISTIPLLLIPQAELARSPAPFADLLDRYVGADSGRVLAAFVVVSGFGALNGWTLIVGELTRSLAANGALPNGLAHTNARGAPDAALVLTGALATALVLMNYDRSLVAAFAFLINVVTAANLPLYLFCSAALAALWLKDRHAHGVAALVLGGAGVAYCVFAFVGVGWEPLKWALVLCAVGTPVWAVQRWSRRVFTAAPETGPRR